MCQFGAVDECRCPHPAVAHEDELSCFISKRPLPQKKGAPNQKHQKSRLFHFSPSINADIKAKG
jgi:hypothetical protein